MNKKMKVTGIAFDEKLHRYHFSDTVIYNTVNGRDVLESAYEELFDRRWINLIEGGKFLVDNMTIFKIENIEE